MASAAPFEQTTGLEFGQLEGHTAQRAPMMVATSSDRGTRSMSTSLMSDRMTRVVNSTSRANTNVHIGSASWNRGSSCGAQAFISFSALPHIGGPDTHPVFT